MATQRYEAITKEIDIYFSLNCPVVLSAYAVLLDNKMKKYSAQLKLRNCGSEAISSVSVVVRTYDHFDEVVEEINGYQYVGINVKQGEEFGTKSLIPLTKKEKIKSLEVTIDKIVFSDGSIWAKENGELLDNTLETKELSSIYSDKDIQNYKFLINSKMKYVPYQKGTFWMCSCGEMNYGEGNCFSCGADKEKVFDYINKDHLYAAILEPKYNNGIELKRQRSIGSLERAITIFEELGDYKDSLEQINACKQEIDIIHKEIEVKKREEEKKEERKAELQRKEAIERAKKNKIVAIIAAAIGIVCVAGFMIVTKVIIPNNNYNAAVKLMENGEYKEAIEAFEALGNYKDSEENQYICVSKVAEKAMTGDSKSLSILSNIPYSYYKEHIEASYSYALVLAAIPDWASAEKYFRMCGDYESAKEYATYCKAKTLIDLSDYGNAMAQIKKIPGFLDSDDILKDLYYQKVASAEKMNLDKAIEILGSASELNQKGQALYDVCCQLQNCTGKYNCYKTKNADGSYGKPSTCQLTFEFYLQEGRPYLRVDNSFFADTEIYDAPVEKGSGDYPYVARCPTSSRDGKIVVHWFSEDEAMTTNASKTGKMYIYRNLGQ